MLFTELRFAAFFAITAIGAWTLRKNGARKLWLLTASYVFYAGWDPRFLALLIASTAGNYWVGRILGERSTSRRAWLAAGIAGNLLLLAAFKYFEFFAGSAAELFRMFGVHVAESTLHVVIPLGISFFTFQGISYLVDVARGAIAAARTPVDFALFIALFPHLVSGPIVRASELLPQFVRVPQIADMPARRALLLFCAGFVKKACIADRIAMAVDPVFAAPAAYGVAAKWLAAALYHVQIYCDFSGYTDMAIALAALLGYTLPPNFDFPYLATSVRSFWRRWHMTLTRWFRDYLYVPLGGNRGSRLRTARNLMLVFLLCGLWHGAAWNFVLWGALHGALLLLERGPLGAMLARAPRLVALGYTNLVVVLAWVVFRSPDLAHATTFLAGLGGIGAAPLAPRTLDSGWLAVLALLGCAHLVARRGVAVRALDRLPDLGFAIVYGAIVAVACAWVATESRPFIYFQF
jgi:alginate O-acetyltransferase complex protein AlgI